MQLWQHLCGNCESVTSSQQRLGDGAHAYTRESQSRIFVSEERRGEWPGHKGELIQLWVRLKQLIQLCEALTGLGGDRQHTHGITITPRCRYLRGQSELGLKRSKLPNETRIRCRARPRLLDPL